jgi:hypothetical protein
VANTCSIFFLTVPWTRGWVRLYDERAFVTLTPEEHGMAAIAWDRIEERDDRAGARRPIQLVTAPPSRRRPNAAVYRRRRLAALVLALALLVVAVQVIGGVLSASASAGAAPTAPTVLVAGPGDTYWDLASQVHQGGDLRSTVDELVRANGGHDLHAGDRIALAD